MRYYYPFIFLLLVSGKMFSQDRLQDYIKEGLENNLLLKQKNISLKQGLIALKEANSLFLPSTNFEAGYTLASGGRAINIPVGDLMNPVYKTLNQLTGTDKFPFIGNLSEQLLPDNFYDTRVRTTMPVLNREIRINRNIKEQQVQINELEISEYKRELVKEIQIAYFNYLIAHHAVSIYESALEIVLQNVKVNQSLLKNGKGLPAYVSRAESEAAKVENQLSTAKNQLKNSGSYLNFLLNAPLNRTIETGHVPSAEILFKNIVDADFNVNHREEVQILGIASRIAQQNMKLSKAYRTPKLNAFLDLGVQGFDMKLNDQSLFYLAGLQLSFPIFHGHGNRLKIGRSELDSELIHLKSEHLIQQLELSVGVARNNAVNVYQSYKSSQRQLEASRQYFKLIDRGFKEGINSFIEYLDARNQLTSSELQINLNLFRLASAVAEFERETSSSNIY